MNAPELTKQTFTVRLAGGATRTVTAFRRAPGAPWTIAPKLRGRKKFHSLGVVGQSKDDLALMRKRAQAWLQELDDARHAPAVPAPAPAKAAAPPATIGETIEAYLAGIEIETDIKAATAMDNARRLRLIVREALVLRDAAAVEAQPLTVLTAGLVERWQDARLRAARDGSTVTKARTRRNVDGVLNKARGLFTTAARACYRKAGLELPDMAGFTAAPMKGNWNSPAYVPIPQPTIAAMDQAAWGELRQREPATFLTYLLMLRLGLRNSEVEHATREWIEHGTAVVMQDGRPAMRAQAFLAIAPRAGWDGPKNGRGRRVPMADDVRAAIEELAGPHHLLGGTAQERWEITHRDICRFVRRFLPGIADDANGRVKAAYELRKHFGAVIASTEGQGLERAAEYLGDRMDTVERHYHAWLQGRTARPMQAEDLIPKILASVA